MQAMHWVLSGLLVVLAAQSGFARCGDNPGDAQAVADARAQAETDCPCAAAVNHGQYVKCVGQVAKARSEADPPLLPKNCKGAVRRCAAMSSCGKPDVVRCCVTKNGVTRCKLEKSEAKCVAKGGVSNGPGSCCDPCGASPSGAFLDVEIF